MLTVAKNSSSNQNVKVVPSSSPGDQVYLIPTVIHLDYELKTILVDKIRIKIEKNNRINWFLQSGKILFRYLQLLKFKQ